MENSKAKDVMLKCFDKSYMDAYDKGVDKYCSNCGQALDWSE